MRTAILLCLFAVFGHIATAQFTLLPQVGLENSRTTIEYNQLSPFSPGCLKAAPQVGLRLDYKFKQLHGPYLGIATSRSVLEYQFSNPETGMQEYVTDRGNTQVRFEGGYQVTSKPIYFKSKSSASSSGSSYKSHCQRMKESYGCGSKSSSSSAKKAKQSPKGTWVRLQPSVGVAYIPSTPNDQIVTKADGNGTSYLYNAGNWRTALTGGLGFEFGRNSTRAFLVSLNYLKGMGNGLDTRTITTVEGNKQTNTSLSSNSSGWNLRMGIPISLAKKKPVVKEQVVERVYKVENKCGQYKMQYKSRCNKTLPEQ